MYYFGSFVCNFQSLTGTEMLHSIKGGVKHHGKIFFVLHVILFLLKKKKKKKKKKAKPKSYLDFLV